MLSIIDRLFDWLDKLSAEDTYGSAIAGVFFIIAGLIFLSIPLIIFGVLLWIPLIWKMLGTL